MSVSEEWPEFVTPEAIERNTGVRPVWAMGAQERLQLNPNLGTAPEPGPIQQLVAVAVAAAYEECARIARELPIAAVNVPPEVKGLLAQHVARIDAAIRARGKA